MNERDNVMRQMKPTRDDLNIRELEEKALLQKRLVEEAATMISKIEKDFNNLSYVKGGNHSKKAGELKAEAVLAFQRYNQLVRELEQTEALIEKHKLQKQAAGEAALAAWKENDRKQRQEYMDSVQRQREQKMLERQKTLERQKALEKLKIESNYRKAKITGIFLGLVFMIVSIIVCSQFLFVKVETTYEKNYITKEIDTYVCYVSQYGECYHRKTCHYIRYSYNVKETTIYAAEKAGLRRCSDCSRFSPTTITVQETIETPKTKTKTNYSASVFVGVGFGIVVYLLCTNNSRKKYKQYSK